jgi:hypothetical protein
MQCSKEPSLLDGLGGFDNSRETDGEGGAAAGGAFDRNIATHHLTEALADGEAKPRATVSARRGGRSLRELLE